MGELDSIFFWGFVQETNSVCVYAPGKHRVLYSIFHYMDREQSKIQTQYSIFWNSELNIMLQQLY